jgi:hypothetical protein
LLSRDADRAVDGNTGAGEQSGQQVTLITLNIGEEASRFDGTAALGHFGRNPRGSDWGGDWDVRLGEAPGSIPSRNCPRNRARLGYPHASRVGRELILHILNPLVALSASRKHPRLVRNAIALVPFLKEQQVLMLARPSDVAAYLVEWSYSPETALETTKDLAALAEFTIDHHFPIFINAGSPRYRRILVSWARGNSPEEAARVLASDLDHEYRQASCGEEELDALTAQVSLLKRWRAEDAFESRTYTLRPRKRSYIVLLPLIANGRVLCCRWRMVGKQEVVM